MYVTKTPSTSPKGKEYHSVLRRESYREGDKVKNRTIANLSKSSPFQGKFAMWQVIARVIDQGSRLSAVRLAETHAGCEVLNIQQDFNEDALYSIFKFFIVDKQISGVPPPGHSERSEA